MINFQNVSKDYEGYKVLEDVSFTIEPKEFVSLIGVSGAGKSTIIKLLIGEDRATKGRVTFGKYDLNKLKPHELPQLRRHIGTVFQDFKLLPTKNVHENIAFALEVAGRPEEDINDLVMEVLDLVDLGGKEMNYINQLSGGEKQRVAIARAMVNRPDLVIADEPTGNLDPQNSQGIINLLKKINEMGTTIILATHNKDIVDELHRRVIHVDDGKIIKDEKKSKYFH